MSVFYVSTKGNDSNDGLSLNTAFATMTKAISSVTEESTIYVDKGEYNITSIKDLSSSKGKVTIKSISTVFIDIPTFIIQSVPGNSNFLGEAEICCIIFTPSDTMTGDTRCLSYTSDSKTVVFKHCLFLPNTKTHVPTTAFFLVDRNGDSLKGKSFGGCTFVNNNGSTIIKNCTHGKLYCSGCMTSYTQYANDNVQYDDTCKFVDDYDSKYRGLPLESNKIAGIYCGASEYVWFMHKYLLKSNGKIYSIKNEYYDSNTKTYNELSENQYEDGYFLLSELTSDVTINEETFKPIDKFTSFKLCTKDGGKFNIHGIKSNAEMVVGKSSFSTSFAENIDYFKLTGDKLDGIKLAVSIDDGSTWKTYDTENATFKDLEITIPSSNYSEFSSADIENWNVAKTKISTDGINASDMSSIDFNKLNSTKIKFAYVLTATSTTEMDSMKNLTWQFDAKGLLRQCTPDEATIEVNSNGVKITSKIDTDILKTNILYES